MQEALISALLKNNQQVPRYTSYPTANHFSDAVGAEQYGRWLTSVPSGEALSLYFHVPFCKRMCWYCGCHTKATEKYEPVAHYLAYLKKEIGMVAARLAGKRKVSHIHFGGGSPSYVDADDFTNFMDHVRDQFEISADAEIAIELDPREITELKVAAYKAAGVNRVSLGVQDFHKDTQEAINRIQPLRQIYDAVKMLRSYDIQNINMDLLYGLPGQTVERIEKNITYAAGLSPQRISLFGYAHVPWMKKHMRLIPTDSLPDGRERLEQFAAAAGALKERGYVQVGLDHFVRATDPMAFALEEHTLVRNFQGYSTDPAEVMVAFGPSAISDLPGGYAQNTTSNRAYFDALDAGRLPTARGIAVSAEDKRVRRLIGELMCYMSVDLVSFAAREGLAVETFQPAIEKLTPLMLEGLVSFSDNVLRVPAEAPQAVRLVCAAFDPYLQVSEQKHAQVA